MKYLLISFLIISLPGLTQVDTLSRGKNQRFIISVSVGTSIPLGDFSFYSKQDYYAFTLSGDPKIGFSSKIDATCLFSKKHFGITISFLSSINKSWSESEGYYYRVPTTAMGSGSVVTSYSYETKNWYFNSLLTGIFVEPIHSPQISIRFWLTGGILQAISPESKLYQTGYIWVYHGSSWPFTENINQPQMFSYKFALNTGTNLFIRLNQKFRAILSVDFLASDAIFKGNIVEDFYDGTNDSYYGKKRPITISKRVYMLYCNLGLSYLIY